MGVRRRDFAWCRGERRGGVAGAPDFGPGEWCGVRGGENVYGQLGDGTAVMRTSAVPAAVAKAKTVATGARHSVVVASDGTVWAWGSNDYGQLGDGTTGDRLTPVMVQNLTGVVAVAAGAYHSVALKGDGSVWAWGYNVGGGGWETGPPRRATCRCAWWG